MSKVGHCNKKATSKGSSSSFVNDDYEYLINCTDLITTCQEALEENSNNSSSVIAQPVDELYKSCDEPIINNNNSSNLWIPSLEFSGSTSSTVSPRASSSAASSGLGLSIEDELSCSMKYYCHSDEEFSSLNSANWNEMNRICKSANNTTSKMATSYTAKALIAEFIEWLDYIDKQLDSVCYCAKISHDANQTKSDLIISNTDVDNDEVVTKNNNDELEEETVVTNQDDNDYDEDEAEELMMSLKPAAAKTSNNNLLCLPETMAADWSVILARHELSSYKQYKFENFKNKEKKF